MPMVTPARAAVALTADTRPVSHALAGSPIRADIAESRIEIEQALGLLRQAVELDPANARAFANLAALLFGNPTEDSDQKRSDRTPKLEPRLAEADDLDA